MIFGKGVTGVYFPEAGVGISDEIFDTFADKFLFHGFTTCGHPVGMAVAKAALKIYIEEGIAEHVTKLGNHVRERLEKEFSPLPNVGQVGGLGLLQAIEIVADKETRRRFPPEADVRSVVLARCWEKGLFPRMYSNFREDRMSVAPPLIITKEEMDKELDIAYSVLKSLKDLKVK
jgi:adenosylmethionine-8-amino-7-oxononanoate aminotransferase